MFSLSKISAFSCAFCAFIATMSMAHAQQIKMLPPDNCTTFNGTSSYGVIGWDSSNPLRCVGGTRIDDSGNLSLAGSLAVNKYLMLKTGGTLEACTTALAGAVRFNSPYFEGCNGTTWVRFGGGTLASGTANGSFTIGQDGVLIASFNVTHPGSSDSPASGTLKIDGDACAQSLAGQESGHGLGNIRMSVTCVSLLSAGDHTIEMQGDSSSIPSNGTWVVYPK